jgi:hypothetical protein
MPVVGLNWWTWEGEWDEQGIYWNMSCVLCGLGVTSLEDCLEDFNSWYLSGWWFGTWLLFFHILGSSSSQLTNSIIYQRGRYTTMKTWVMNLHDLLREFWYFKHGMYNLEC